MSLHAQLSPEAQAKLNAQKRNSTISSIIIALLVCALLVAILFYIALSPLFKNTEEMVTYASGSEAEEKIVKPEMNNEVEKKPSSPSSSMAKVIAANTPSPTAVPVPDQVVTEPSLDFGDGDDFGDGWGSGSGNGAGGGGAGFGIPASMKKRCSAKDRIERLLKEGGQEDYEDKVVASLRWLKKTQQKDGSWNAQGKPVAMTGLALLAYLGHCETPASSEFGETVQNAIMYLISVSQKNGGKLASSTADKHWCYEHSIATYAMAEAYTLCKEFKIPIPNLEETVKAAGDFIIGSQHESGGWDYAYDTSGKRGGDTSIACWHLQAVKACKTTKIDFNGLEKCARIGIEYLDGAKNGKGTIGYNTNGKNLKHGPTMTPGGALCFQQWGKGNRSFTRNAIIWITENSEFDYKTEANLYMHYYSSQAMINAGGSAWKDYNKKVMINLADNQSADGSWAVPGGARNQMSSAHYATCLSTLMMEVYYRFLPSSE
ncbi:MAG: hypothetical protein ACSHX6_12170 [Akkermansiaceae bacterium]